LVEKITYAVGTADAADVTFPADAFSPRVAGLLGAVG
jgi:hypothetical protein